MAKCYNCGKIFDYEKYYGICPKCSAYNREILPDEQHEERYKEDNYQVKLHNEYEEGNYQEEQYKEYEGTYHGEKILNEKKTSSVPSVLVFIILLVGIAAGIAAPLGYGTFCIVSMVKEDAIFSNTYEQKTKKIPQNPEIITKESGEAFTLGRDTQCQIQVEQAYIVARGDEVKGFPQGENLVAVKLEYETGNTEVYDSYYFMGEPYIKFDGRFRNSVSDYVLKDYEEIISEETILDVWKMCSNANGTGLFLFFVPAEVTNLHFYMDSRAEDTNDISVIYEVPLEINAGEGI